MGWQSALTLAVVRTIPENPARICAPRGVGLKTGGVSGVLDRSVKRLRCGDQMIAAIKYRGLCTLHG
jgi:hypothetical protein